MRKRQRLRLLLLLGVAAVAAAFALLAYATDTFDSLENDSIDERFTIRGDEKPPSDLVIVGIDDKTLRSLGVRFPFPRQYHARVIDRLKADGAKVIAFDIVFAEREP